MAKISRMGLSPVWQLATQQGRSAASASKQLAAVWQLTCWQFADGLSVCLSVCQSAGLSVCQSASLSGLGGAVSDETSTEGRWRPGGHAAIAQCAQSCRPLYVVAFGLPCTFRFHSGSLARKERAE